MKLLTKLENLKVERRRFDAISRSVRYRTSLQLKTDCSDYFANLGTACGQPVENLTNGPFGQNFHIARGPGADFGRKFRHFPSNFVIIHCPTPRFNFNVNLCK